MAKPLPCTKKGNGMVLILPDGEIAINACSRFDVFRKTCIEGQDDCFLKQYIGENYHKVLKSLTSSTEE